MENAQATRKWSFAQTNRIRRFALACAVSLVMCATCFAGDITLQWDTETAPDLAGYKVYYSTNAAMPFAGSGAAEGASPVAVAIQNRATITGLDPEQSYYFAVTAYNTAGLESPYSNVISVSELVPPTVSITYPANNALVNGTVSVSSSASDNQEVTRLETYLNGVLQATDTAPPYLFSWNTDALAAGAYTLSAKAYDAAGNVGQSTNVSVTVGNDVSPPAVALTAPGTGATVRGALAITANATDDIAVTKLELYANGTLIFAGNVAPYSYSWDTTGVANGYYTLSAKAYDATGKVGQSAGVLVNVQNVPNDNIAPAVSIASPITNSKASGTVTVSAKATDNIAVAKVQFFLNGALVSTASAAPYSFSWNTLNSANGAYTLVAKAYDAAGNVGQSANVSVTVLNDKTAPAVAIASPVTGSKAAGTVTVSASATDNIAVAKVQFFLNGALASTATAAPYSFSWNTLNSPNGAYTLVAKAFDAAGNVGQSANVSVTVLNDKTAPAVAIGSPVTGSKAAGTVTVSASATDNVGVKKVEFYLNGVLQSSVLAAPYSFSWNTLKSANGVYTLVAKAFDAAGNVGQSANVSVTVFNDTIAPVVAIGSPVAGSKASGTVTVSASATDNVGVKKVEFYLNGHLQSSVLAAPYNFSWNTLNSPNGAYTLVAKAYDAAGNVGQSAAVSVTVFNDKTAPAVAIGSPVAGSKASGTVTVSASATDNVGVQKVNFYLNGHLYHSATTAPYSFSWNTLNSPNGSYTLVAKAFDAAGNVGQSAAVSVTVLNDTTAPILSLYPVATTLTGSRILSGSVSDNVAVGLVTVQVNKGVAVKAALAGSNWSSTLTGLVVGTNVITVKATDTAGNIALATTSVIVK